MIVKGKQYRMKFNGLTGRIKKTQAVEALGVEFGVVMVRAIGSEQEATDYAMTLDLEEIRDEAGVKVWAR